MCRAAEESVQHLFLQCHFTQGMYEVAFQHLRVGDLQTRVNMPADYIHAVRDKNLNVMERSLLIIIHFILWRERCNMIFRGTELSIMELLEQIKEEMHYMRKN